MTRESYDVIVIGGGQAGLAAGYHLATQGMRFVILEAQHRIGESWRRRWDSLRVFTPARFNGLPGMPFPGSPHSYATRDVVANYLEAYARHMQLPVRTGVRVDRLTRSHDGPAFVAQFGDLRFEASQVVVATGAFERPNVPAFASALGPGIRRLHSSEYRNPSQLAPGGVLVVGAGNSGAEIALEVAQDGHQTWLSGRHTGEELPVRMGSLPDRLLTPALWFLFSRILTTATPLGRKARAKVLAIGGHPLARVKPRDLIEASIERVPRTGGVQDGRPVLEDGRVMQVVNVIWCTGFRSDFGWIDLPILDERGHPIHERGVVASQPGLYFVGLFFLHALTSSLIGGVGRDARYIVDRIAARAAATGRPRAALTRSGRVPADDG